MQYSQVIQEPITTLLDMPSEGLMSLQDQACHHLAVSEQLTNEAEAEIARELMVRLFLANEYQQRRARLAARRNTENFGFLGRADG